jgi:hypothetical protein
VQKNKKVQITEKIWLAIRKVESRNLDRPYANISEISRESGISRPTIYNHLHILKIRQEVFEAKGKGRGTWVQSRFAKSARKTYELMLKKEAELKQFMEQPPQEVDTTTKDFPEKLTLGVSFFPSELDMKVRPDIEQLRSILRNFRNVFSKHSNILIFAEKYGKLVSDLEEMIKQWFYIIWNKERYLESKFLPFLQEGFPVLTKILCDLKALVNTANFICDNQLLDKRVIFAKSTNEILNQCAFELDALFDSLDVTL